MVGLLMAMKPSVTLLSEHIARCKERGAAVLSNFRHGNSEASRYVSTHNAEQNLYVQVHARMAECAFAIWAGLDPFLTLNWSPDIDAGFDIHFNCRRVDIKATGANGRNLIWPIGKRSIWKHKKLKFDDLVLVRGDPPTFVIAGIVTKERFEREHLIASEEHPLDTGTWYMHEKTLDELPTRNTDRRFLDGLYVASMTKRHLYEWNRRVSLCP